MNDLLAGRSVIVTGAGSGIGRASAELFANEGAQVLCADLRSSWAEETVRSIEAAGGTARALPCDVRDADAVDAAVQAAVSAYGRLDVMFNNAGIASPRQGMLLEDHTPADFEQLLAVNCVGVFNGCAAALRQFKHQGTSGAIVNTGSIAGMVGWGGVPYGATKGLVIQLTRALAIEAAPYGIRVNCICPGGIRTRFGQSPDQEISEPSDEELAFLRTLHPLGQLITPDDCARAALFLASDLSNNMTGVALPVDGGYVCR